MDRRQALTYNVTGQELELYRPDWLDGAASGASARIWRGGQGNDEAPILSPAVTVDSVSLQVTGAAGYSSGNRKLVPMNTTGLQLRRLYVIENGAGQRELVRVARIVAGVEVHLEHDLAYDYPAAASSLVKGLRASLAIDPTFIATVGNINLKGYLSRQGLYPDDIDIQSGTPYRVEWAYTVAGTARRHWTYFDVVRGQAQHGVLPTDLAEIQPDLFGQEARSQRGQKFQPFIDNAFRRVCFDLRAKRMDPNQIADDALDDLVRAATFMLIAESGRAPPNRDPEAYVRECVGRYLRDRDAVTEAPTLNVSQSTGGEITPDPVPPPFFRS